MSKETECGACMHLRTRVKRAAEECNRSLEVDLRLLHRRHVRDEHGRELPLPQ